MHRMRVLHPVEGVYAFYDGRIDGYRFALGGPSGFRSHGLTLLTPDACLRVITDARSHQRE